MNNTNEIHTGVTVVYITALYCHNILKENQLMFAKKKLVKKNI